MIPMASEKIPSANQSGEISQENDGRMESPTVHTSEPEEIMSNVEVGKGEKFSSNLVSSTSKSVV